MSDLREPEPAQRILDLEQETSGNHPFSAEIYVWPYSSLKNEKVYSRKVIVHFRAMDMQEAHGFAQAIRKTIAAAHDVWETGINRIEVRS